MTYDVYTPRTSEFFRHLRSMEEGSITYPGNAIRPVAFTVRGVRRVAASTYAAVEWLKENVYGPVHVPVVWGFDPPEGRAG